MEEQDKTKKAIDGYVTTSKLEDKIRSGWTQNYEIERQRLESIAEHTYKTQQLAINVWLSYPKEYKDIDIFKVLAMISIHDNAEAITGDKTIFVKTKEDESKERAVIRALYRHYENGEIFINLYKEFEERKTPEAKFAHMCDKLDAVLQAEIYTEEGCTNMENLEGKPCMNSSLIRSLVEQGLSLGQVFAEYSIQRDGLDKPFTEVAQYVKTHKILPPDRRKNNEN